MPESNPLFRWLVNVSGAAETDFAEIISYFIGIEEFDHADALLDEFEEAKKSLEAMPERAHFTEELKNIGVYSHREIHFRTYRVIFRLDGEQGLVLVDAILDGRRDVEQILAERMILRSG